MGSFRPVATGSSLRIRPLALGLMRNAKHLLGPVRKIKESLYKVNQYYVETRCPVSSYFAERTLP